jgi:hypothetical protein
MGPEAIRASEPRIDETEGHNRREKSSGVAVHREFVHEIAVGEVVFDGPGVAFVRQDFLVDSQLVAEKREFLFLRFEVCEVLIAENEIDGDSGRW